VDESLLVFVFMAVAKSGFVILSEAKNLSVGVETLRSAQGDMLGNRFF
jgi:hypothetical protein